MDNTRGDTDLRRNGIEIPDWHTAAGRPVCGGGRNPGV